MSFLIENLLKPEQRDNKSDKEEEETEEMEEKRKDSHEELERFDEDSIEVLDTGDAIAHERPHYLYEREREEREIDEGGLTDRITPDGEINHHRGDRNTPDRAINHRNERLTPDRAINHRVERLTPDRPINHRGERLTPDRAIGQRGERLSPEQTISHRDNRDSPDRGIDRRIVMDRDRDRRLSERDFSDRGMVERGISDRRLNDRGISDRRNNERDISDRGMVVVERSADDGGMRYSPLPSRPTQGLSDNEGSSFGGEFSTPRKRRVLFTRKQTYELEKVFQYQQYLTISQRDYLSKKTNLTPTQVKIWFQNHRYKIKKHQKESLSEASVPPPPSPSVVASCRQCKCELARCKEKPPTYYFTKQYLHSTTYLYDRRLPVSENTSFKKT